MLVIEQRFEHVLEGGNGKNNEYPVQLELSKSATIAVQNNLHFFLYCPYSLTISVFESTNMCL